MTKNSHTTKDPHTAFQCTLYRQLRDDTDLTLPALRVGMLIVDQLWRSGDNPRTGALAGQVRESQSAIAAKLEITLRTVERAIATLQARGHLAVYGTPWRGSGRGRAHVNAYRPLLWADPQGTLDFGEYPTAVTGIRPRKTKDIYPTGETGIAAETIYPTNETGMTPTEMAGKTVRPSFQNEKKTESLKRESQAGSLSQEGRQPRSRSRGAVVPDEPTLEMITYANQQAAWSASKAYDEYRAMLAHFADQPIRNLEAAWLKWVKRGVEYEQRNGQRPQTGVASFAIGAMKHLNRTN
jgi:hypothetical protein